MYKYKPLTEKDCLLELERVCRIVVEQKVEENEIAFFRNTLQGALDKLAKLREDKNDIAAKRQADREKAKYNRAFRKS